MQGNYEQHTGFQGTSQNYDDYELVDVVSDKSCTFIYKNKVHGYEVIGKFINDTFVARKVDEI